MKKSLRSFTISIPKPCSENWETMTTLDKSKFCASCQKCVTDFTQYSDREIAAMLNTRNKEVCGRFTKQQLDTVYSINNQSKSSWISFYTLFSAASIIPIYKAIKLDTIHPLELNFQPVPFKVKIAEEKKTDSIPSSSFLISGRVIDESTSEGLMGAPINIKGTLIGAIADMDGKFSFEIPPEYYKDSTMIVFSFIGYESTTLSLRELKLVSVADILLKPSGNILGGDVVVFRVKSSLWRKIKIFFRKKRTVIKS